MKGWVSVVEKAWQKLAEEMRVNNLKDEREAGIKRKANVQRRYTWLEKEEEEYKDKEKR